MKYVLVLVAYWPLPSSLHSWIGFIAAGRKRPDTNFPSSLFIHRHLLEVDATSKGYFLSRTKCWWRFIFKVLHMCLRIKGGYVHVWRNGFSMLYHVCLYLGLLVHLGMSKAPICTFSLVWNVFLSPSKLTPYNWGHYYSIEKQKQWTLLILSILKPMMRGC